jgi:hypothetical protein
LSDYPDDECALEVQKDVENVLRFLSKVRIIHGFQSGAQMVTQKDKILI